MIDINCFEINDGVLEGYRYDGEVVIPDEVTVIGESAFEGYENIESVIIPNGVITIGEWAFANCTNLRSVEISNGVTEIGYEAFSGCKKLSSINIPDSVTSIGANAFSECVGLYSIEIPSSVVEIGEGAFGGCYQLVITAPEGSYAAEYIEKNNLKPIDIDSLLEEVDEDSADEIDSIRIVYEVDEGYALSFYHLILKKYDDEIQLIGRYGCEEDDEDLNRIEMYEEYFGEDRDLQLYALLVNEFNKSYESFGKSNSDIFAVAGDTRRTACITPTMMAIFKEFMIWDNDVLYDTYSVIYNCFIKQMEEK